MLRLEQQITRLGRIRQQLRTLESEEQRIAEAVRAQMLEHGRNRIEAESFEARLETVERLTISPRKLRQAMEEKDFLSCVTVSITKARRFVGERGLRKMAKIARSHRLRLVDRTAVQSQARPSAA